LSTLLKAHLGFGIVSSTPFWVVPSHESQGVARSSPPDRGRGDAGGDARQHHLDLILQQELAIALHGVLRCRLLLDDELHGRPEDPPAL